MVIRKLLLVSFIVLLGTESAIAESREEIEARIRALSSELYQLRQQLQQVEDPTESESTTRPNLLPEEVALEDLNERRQFEQESSRNPFAITTHRTNYLFPISYSTNQNSANFRSISADSTPNDVEMKFQFSAKFNLAENVFGDIGDVYFAYTQRSWWQAYNTVASSPFRDTQY